jgi:uncharacterized repeat protein (TIGR01451 family)
VHSIERAAHVTRVAAVLGIAITLTPRAPLVPERDSLRVSVAAQGSIWPAGYSRRRSIDITTGPNTPFNGYQGYTVRVAGFDTATEIAQGDMRADANDLRVMYWDGSNWVDVPRIVSGFNTADTHVIFQSQTDIPANGADGNHFIFFGNPTAGSPPAVDYTNVYLWYDDFSANPFSGSPRYTRAKAVDIHGDAYTAPSWFGRRVRFNTGDNNPSDFYVNNAGFSNTERDVLITIDHRANQTYPVDATGAIVARLSAINTSSSHVYAHYSRGNYSDSPGIAWDSWTNGERNVLGGAAAPPSYWPLRRAGTWAFAVFGTTARFWDDGDLDAEPWYTSEAPLLSGTTPAPQPGYVGVAPSQSRGWLDNLIVRRYTEPEPATVLGPKVGMFAAMTIGKSVNPLGSPPPGTDLTYTLAISNVGTASALSVVVADTLPQQVDFQVGSVASNLPPGISTVVEYSNDNGASWTYLPASAGCAAPAGYDRCVDNIRWLLQADLTSTPPDNSGTLRFVARIR